METRTERHRGRRRERDDRGVRNIDDSAAADETDDDEGDAEGAKTMPEPFVL